jgi:hypothetical protein
MLSDTGALVERLRRVGFDAFTEPAARLEQLAKSSCETDVEATINELRELARRMVVPVDADSHSDERAADSRVFAECAGR